MEPSDAELILRTQSGDKEAFGIIVRRYMKRAYHAALTIVGEYNEAMDLSQEAFARAYRGIKGFDTSMPFFPWYYRTLRNLWINRKRKDKGLRFTSLLHSETQDEDTPALELASNDEGPYVAAEKGEMASVLVSEMAALDSEKREILHLRHFENLSYRDIALTLDIPEGTVMSRLHSARQALRDRMEKYL
jgi:RNA polymerase sigma-70 factor (ECF subfamily)